MTHIQMTRTFKSITALSILVLALILQGCSIFGIRSSEEAAYKIVLTDGPFEIRQYAKVMMVETSVTASSFEEATDVTFNRLFDYISGENIQNEDVSMTAPVFSSRSGEKIEMTSPVLSSVSGSKESTWTLAFVLPDHYQKSNAPKPSDPNVVLVEQPEKRVAVVSFSGLWDQERFDQESKKLQSWIRENGYTSVGPDFFAGYDPPWTLPFLRRNEVMRTVMEN